MIDTSVLAIKIAAYIAAVVVVALLLSSLLSAFLNPSRLCGSAENVMSSSLYFLSVVNNLKGK